MVTGGVRTVLLVVSLAAAASSMPPLCKAPPLEVMEKMNRCARKNMDEMPSAKPLMQHPRNMTKNQIVAYLQDYCTSAIPAGLTCFQDKISGCDAELQASFMQAAESGVGLLCQPSGRGINPAMAAVFDNFSDEEVTHVLNADLDEGCHFNDSRQWSCYHKGHSSPDPYTLSSLDELVPWLQRTAVQLFDCSIDLYRGLKSTCPSWRLVFLVELDDFLLVTLLGVSLPYTPEQLLERLEM